MAVRPWQWKLTKISREDLSLHDSLRHFFPSLEIRSAVAVAIRTALVKHLGQEVLLFDEGTETMKYGQFAEELGDGAVLVAIGLPPAKEKLFLQIDHDLAGLLVDRLMGGSGERGTEPIALTDTEQGVLQYLIMQCLAAVHQATGKEARFHFRFHQILTKSSAQASALPPTATVLVMLWRFGLGERMGMVRLLLPEALLRSASRKVATETTPRASREQAMRFAGDRMQLWADAGQCVLTPADMAGLDAGDVILFDQSGIQLSEGKLTGEVTLRLGKGEHGGIRAAIEPGKTLRLRVQSIEEGSLLVGE